MKHQSAEILRHSATPKANYNSAIYFQAIYTTVPLLDSIKPKGNTFKKTKSCFTTGAWCTIYLSKRQKQ